MMSYITNRYTFLARYYTVHMSSTTRLYLAGLGPDPDKRQVEKEFSYYGRLDDVWLSKPPFGYGFVQFKSSRDGR